uniref:B30.2/SPRY domain-containing protein n=1 Tax=Cyprinus carpio TaxID=7962 RepID=A0A8C2E7L7_CYPCA
GTDVCLQDNNWPCTNIPKLTSSNLSDLWCHPKKAQNHYHRHFSGLYSAAGITSLSQSEQWSLAISSTSFSPSPDQLIQALTISILLYSYIYICSFIGLIISIVLLICKLLWINVSAKLLHVNVNLGLLFHSPTANHGPHPYSGFGTSAPPSPYVNPALTNIVPRTRRADFKKISDRVTFTNIVPRTRNDFLQDSHQLTLNLNTVNNYLRLSERNRVITNTDTDQSYPDHPDRFDYYYQVLCRESVCGRCYWEIDWSGFGVCISVSYKSISRKGYGNKCLFGYNDQCWSLYSSPSSYLFMHNKIETYLSVKSISSRIGLFVDHGAGTLSFYSVSDTLSLIHTVQNTFTQPLYPGFYVAYGSSVKLC